jgi:hypothetical protein
VTAPAEPPDDDLWVVAFRVPPDPVPGGVRMRRILKPLGRYYHVEPLEVRSPTPEERAPRDEEEAPGGDDVTHTDDALALLAA